MADAEKVVMEKPIDLSFEVNEGGLTGRDLLTTLMGELQKRGYFLAGVIISQDIHDGILVIGHQGKLSKMWPIDAMKYAIEKYEHAAEVHEEQVKSRTN
jgi:hypothetical protein